MSIPIKSSNIYNDIVQLQNQGERIALVTVISSEGSTPREVGAKMIVKEDGSIIDTIGGGAVEMLVIRDALEVIKKGIPKLVSYSLDENIEGEKTGMVCGGKMDFFIEPIISNPLLYIFGAGHVGKALYEIAAMCNFRIVIIDNRKEYLNVDLFPKAVDIVFCDYKNLENAIKIKEDSYIVIVTHSHFTDEIVLKALLKMNIKYRYLGIIGSKRKSEELKKILKEEGFSDNVIDSIHCPIGIFINSKTPEEIAISIMAEIIKLKNSQNGG